MNAFEEPLRAAVRFFWEKRSAQTLKQGLPGGRKDAGDRGAVTGGKQMDGFVELICSLLTKAGEEFVAVLELKSQIGSSFGNNFNNRFEEALGSASDLSAAYREGAFKPSPKPWVGYLMLLEDCEASRRPVGVEEPHFKVFPEFREASYAGRYEILLKKLVRDQLYDAAALLLSPRAALADGAFIEPNAELSFANLVTGLIGRAVAAHAKAAAG